MKPGSAAAISGVLFSCLIFSACGSHRLEPDEIERNRLFAAILEREDRRTLGDDGLLKSNLEKSPYPEVREWSARALGRIGSPYALPWLYEALRSPYAAVRASSAFAIGKIEDRGALKQENRRPDPRAVRELETLLADTSVSVQMRSLEALGRCGSSAEALKISDRLKAWRYDGTPEGREFLDAGITALTRLAEPRTFSTLEKLAELEDPEIQWRALNALIRVGDRRARPHFIRLLESNNAAVRFYAARGLGICADPALARLLVPLLPPAEAGRAPNPVAIRIAALQSLARLRNRETIPAIKEALFAVPISPKDPDQVNFAIQAAATLGIIGDPAAETVLLPLLRESGPVANSAVIALGRLLRQTPERFFDAVRDFSIAEPPAARSWAIALGELGGERAIAELKAALMRAADERSSHADLLALPAVLEAITRAGVSNLGMILMPYLTSHDGVVVRAALKGYTPPPGSRAPWMPILEAYGIFSAGRDVETKVALMDRLEPWIQAPEVQAALRSMLQDRERNARIAAGRLLRAAGATDIPDDPGPAVTGLTLQTYSMAAADRKDRTLVILETARGDIEIELHMEDAPLTSANFIWLVKRGFFDGLTFMRVVPNFVVQSGDPRNDQEGGPGYSIRCETNGHPFRRGAVGMALAGKDTGGSQFFIATAPQPHLDGEYTCFGQVVGGMPVVDRLIPGDRIVRARAQEEAAILDFRRF